MTFCRRLPHSAGQSIDLPAVELRSYGRADNYICGRQSGAMTAIAMAHSTTTKLVSFDHPGVVATALLLSASIMIRSLRANIFAVRHCWQQSGVLYLRNRAKVSDQRPRFPP